MDGAHDQRCHKQGATPAWPAAARPLLLFAVCVPCQTPSRHRLLLCPVQATDVPSLLRAKAELETRCQMLESQIAKMQVGGGMRCWAFASRARLPSSCRSMAC